MRGKDYMAVLRAVTEVMGEAIHIVDASGKTILYNEAMAQLEKISVEDALGKPFRQVFGNIPESESTLYQALVNRQEIRNKQQTYEKYYKHHHFPICQNFSPQYSSLINIYCTQFNINIDPLSWKYWEKCF